MSRWYRSQFTRLGSSRCRLLGSARKNKTDLCYHAVARPGTKRHGSQGTHRRHLKSTFERCLRTKPILSLSGNNEA